jgi:predicted transposase YbfD/YdcC
VHLLSILDQQTGCVLSQTAVDEKTNEAKVALSLLETLVLRGRVVVADAMFCQREVCEAILQQGGHYLIVVKDNQPTLRRDLEAAFADEAAFSPLRQTPIPRRATDGRIDREEPRPNRATTARQQHRPE